MGKVSNKINMEMGHAILICGGSSSGKSSAVKVLLNGTNPLPFVHLDFDIQVQKLARDESEISNAIDQIIDQLPKVIQQKSFVMDHWMPPRREKKVRAYLFPYKIFYVWLYCSDIEELKKREEKRISEGDGRGESMAISGHELDTSLEYDFKLDTYGLTPGQVANRIRKEALKHWGYKK